MASGFNVVDFMSLPGVERCILRLILRAKTMTYPQLRAAVETMPEDQKMDQAKLDSALDHLLRSQWLVRNSSGQLPRYRVNSMQRSSSQNQGFWDTLELESIDQDRLSALELKTAEKMLTPNRGRRKLPQHIWECLSDPVDEPKTELPARRTGLLDKLMDDDGSRKTQ